jgi:hypothetical protein
MCHELSLIVMHSVSKCAIQHALSDVLAAQRDGLSCLGMRLNSKRQASCSKALATLSSVDDTHDTTGALLLLMNLKPPR